MSSPSGPTCAGRPASQRASAVTARTRSSPGSTDRLNLLTALEKEAPRKGRLFPLCQPPRNVAAGPGLVDGRQPVVVLGHAAADDVEVELRERSRDRAYLARADLAVIDLHDRRDLRTRAA